MQPDVTTLREIKKTKLICLLMWVATPPIYIMIGFFSDPPAQSGGQIDMMLYMLLIIATVTPLLIPVIENFQINKFRQLPPSNASPAQYMLVVYLTRYAVVEACYIYGLVTYFLSADPTRAMLFVPIGAIWSFIYWPRDEKIMRTLERLEAP